jgi:hypothetical protein
VEDGFVRGVVIEDGRRLRSKIVIDAEGSQGLVAVKAGVRKRYPAEAISLADTYDYVMPKDKIDEVFGHSIRFCWGWDEQKIAPPLGYGNGLMVWPYRQSVHFMQDQCLRLEGKRVVNLRRAFDEYHERITTRLPWWKDRVAPNIRLRARMWEGFEIFVGLDDELRSLPNHADGVILIGDTAGLESTELCDGVPAAWFSADIAADVAIKAVRAGDTSRAFLKRYDTRIRKHPIIQWSIRATNRYNLRNAQKSHDEKELKRYIHHGWGMGALSQVSSPLTRTLLFSVVTNPRVITSWIRMFFRYYSNWHHGHFDDDRAKAALGKPSRTKKKGNGRAFAVITRVLDILLFVFDPIVRMLALLAIPLSWLANLSARISLPVLEPIYAGLLSATEGVSDRVSKRLVAFTSGADPSVFDAPAKERKGRDGSKG